MRSGEFELIRALSEKLPPPAREVVVSIGDDAAVVKAGDFYQLLSTDALVEGSHFKREWKGKVRELFFFLGKKLVNICASDVASMGGVPKWGLVNLGAPKESPEEELLELYEGIGQATGELNISVVGGDTVNSKTLFFDMTIIGESSRYMLRSNAEPGELVGVTGTLGDSRGGLELLLNGRADSPYLIERFLSPRARVREGREALAAGVRCATDISDGLLFNLGTIAHSSGVKIEIESSRIPLSRELKEKFGPDRALEFALYGGEDYELIITFPESLADRLERAGFKVIGQVLEGEGLILDGKKVKPVGYDHFRRKNEPY